MDNTNLDTLFSAARNAAPEITFEAAQASFAGSLMATGSTSVWMKLVNTFKNPYIMIGTTGIIIASVMFSAFSGTTSETVPQENPISNEVRQASTSLEKHSEEEEKTQPKEMVKEQVSSPETADFTEEIDREEATPEKLKTETANEVTFSQSNEIVSSTGYESNKEETREFVYVISHKTSKAELEKIQQEAEKAGIDFSFKMKKNQLRKLKMQVKNSSNSYTASMMFSSDFEKTIGWVTNEKGEFQGFYESE